MIALGALCAAVAAGAAISMLRRESDIERRLRRLLPVLGSQSRWRPVADRDLRHSAIPVTQTDIAAAKILGLLVGAVVGGVAGNTIALGAPAALVCAFGGFVVPSLVVERRAAARRRAAERPIEALFERLEALAGSGRPVETALAALARIASGSQLLDVALRDAAGAYALGAPLFRSLAFQAMAQGLDGLGTFALALERSRDLGEGSLAVVREAREAARSRRRTRSLEVAGKVESKLMLTLVLCYLPALFLLVVIPLFLTLLDGLFG